MLRLVPGAASGLSRVQIQRDLPVLMNDGSVLAVDHYHPRGTRRAPVILIRSPMGRRPLGLLYGGYFAWHGFRVIVQNTRDVSPRFQALDAERADGLATVNWMRRQPWFQGRFAMHGISSLGHVQWSIATQIPELRAMSVHNSASNIGDAIFTGGSFALESTLAWCSNHDLPSALTATERTRRAIRSGAPLNQLDTLTTGAPVAFFQEALDGSEPGSQLRARLDYSRAVRAADLPPVHLVGGWYDVFLPGQIADYLAMRAAGHQPYLTVGPWFHYDPRHLLASAREAVGWFRAHLLDRFQDLREQPVRLYVTGVGEWRDFADWPVPGAHAQRWLLQSGHRLGPAAPVRSEPDRYLYDPVNPTPAPRGPVLIGDSRPEDNRWIEKRDDVLSYTSDPVRGGLEVIGPVIAELYLRSDRVHTDLLARLCDVRPDGISLSVCEGIRRLAPGDPPADADGVRRVRIELWPAAHRFRAGRRLRLQVCSGALPRFPRNPGTGEPLGSASTMLAATQEIFHDPDRPSGVLLHTMT